MSVEFRRPRWRRRLDNARRDPFGVVMWVVGDRTVGGRSVPGSWRSETIDHRNRSSVSWLSVMADNDAFGVVVRRYEGDPADPMSWNEWKHVYLDLNRREARSLAWLLVRWFAADWFGLRRAIYYWALHRHVARFRAASPSALQSEATATGGQHDDD